MKNIMIAMLGIAMLAGVAGAAGVDVAVITTNGYIKLINTSNLTTWVKEVDYGDTNMQCIAYDPVSDNFIVGENASPGAGGTSSNSLLKTSSSLPGTWDADKASRGVNVTDITTMGNGQIGMVQDGWTTILNASDLAIFDTDPTNWPAFGRDITPAGGDDYTLRMTYLGTTNFGFATDHSNVDFTKKALLTIDDIPNVDPYWADFVFFTTNDVIADVCTDGNGNLVVAFSNSGLIGIREVIQTNSLPELGGWLDWAYFGSSADIEAIEYDPVNNMLVVMGNASDGSGFIATEPADDIESTNGWQTVWVGLGGEMLDIAVIAPATTIEPGEPTIMDFSSVPGSSNIMKMVVNVTSGAEAAYFPVVTSDLVGETTWSNRVPHSDTAATGGMAISNLSYSVADGTNRVIYVEADVAEKFYRVKAE